MHQAIRLNGTDPLYDLNQDGLVSRLDVKVLVEVSLKTGYGDANLDGVFDSGDLLAIFAAGEFEDNIPLNSGWADGDWDGDGEFGTSDLILALQSGNYDA